MIDLLDDVAGPQAALRRRSGQGSSSGGVDEIEHRPSDASGGENVLEQGWGKGIARESEGRGVDDQSAPSGKRVQRMELHRRLRPPYRKIFSKTLPLLEIANGDVEGRKALLHKDHCGGSGRSAGAQEQGASLLGVKQRQGRADADDVRVVSHGAPAVEGHHIHGPTAGRLRRVGLHQGEGPFLVGHGDVGPHRFQRRESSKGLGKARRLHAEGKIAEVELQSLEGRVLHAWRKAVGHRIAQKGHETCHDPDLPCVTASRVSKKPG